MYTEREGERDACLKESTHTAMRAGKSKICRAGQQAGNAGRTSVTVLRQNSFSRRLVFALKAFPWLDNNETHPPY